MSRSRVFVSTDQLSGDKAILTGDAFHHVRRVLRLGFGDRLVLFDGEGLEVEAEISEVRGRQLELHLLERHRIAPWAGPRMTLICAELKSDKSDWALQKITELGVDRYVPVSCQRTVVRSGEEAAGRRHARRLKIVQEASRQSCRAYLPEVACVQPLGSALEAYRSEVSLIFWEEEETRLCNVLSEVSRSVTLVIGPEGGFTAREVSEARALGYLSASLGQLILRAETAAVAAVSIVGAHIGRLG